MPDASDGSFIFAFARAPSALLMDDAGSSLITLALVGDRPTAQLTRVPAKGDWVIENTLTFKDEFVAHIKLLNKSKRGLDPRS